jgi:hypothetical protein
MAGMKHDARTCTCPDCTIQRAFENQSRLARYEVSKDGARLFITVLNGTVTRAESPTHGCFDANFIGKAWADVRKDFEDRGFLVHTGN